jgi:tetratricopeptide (TPR) repeat protein
MLRGGSPYTPSITPRSGPSPHAGPPTGISGGRPDRQSGYYGLYHGHPGDGDHGRNWGDHGAGRGFYHYGYGYGYGYGVALVMPLWYPGWYGLYGGPDYDYYGYYGGGWPYYGSEVTVYSVPTTPVQTAEAPLVEAEKPAEPVVSDDYDGTGSGLGQQYAAQARDTFRTGAYREALRHANHAAVEMPRNAAVHELMSLALFALKEYRAAAIEAHAAIALGRVSDWPTVYAYYGDEKIYTSQFRALEKHLRDSPKSPEATFLMGYHDVLTGNKEAAKKQLTAAVELTPKDEIAKQLLKQVTGDAPDKGL